jgi:Zn-dependent peptidase ImmA (M78 family)
MKSLIKTLLRESLLNEVDMTNRALMNKFILFVNDYLSLEKPCRVKLTTDREDITTTAYYDIVNRVVCVYIKDRAIMDVMRSVAHELVHHHQNEKGQLKGLASEGADGSDIENEANAKAGEIIRVFGKQNPEIYTNNQ